MPNGNIPSLAGAQRSRVASLVVVFDQAVQLDANAFTLGLNTNNIVYNGAPPIQRHGRRPQWHKRRLGRWLDRRHERQRARPWNVAFVGANLDTGADGLNSLQDGVYQFFVDRTKVHPRGAPNIRGAADQTTVFHRLAGDTGLPNTPASGTAGVDFQALVNSGDNLPFRGAFNNAANYKAFLDFNDDGTINSGDNLQFRNRFNKVLMWKV